MLNGYSIFIIVSCSNYYIFHIFSNFFFLPHSLTSKNNYRSVVSVCIYFFLCQRASRHNNKKWKNIKFWWWILKSCRAWRNRQNHTCIHSTHIYKIHAVIYHNEIYTPASGIDRQVYIYRTTRRRQFYEGKQSLTGAGRSIFYMMHETNTNSYLETGPCCLYIYSMNFQHTWQLTNRFYIENLIIRIISIYILRIVLLLSSSSSFWYYHSCFQLSCQFSW